MDKATEKRALRAHRRLAKVWKTQRPQTAGMERQIENLKRLTSELSAAAGYFEELGMDTQVLLLDEAADGVVAVRGTLEALLGLVPTPEDFVSGSKKRAASPRAATGVSLAPSGALN